MIYKANPSKDFFIGLNRNRITNGFYSKHRIGENPNIESGSVVVETDDVRRANVEKEIEEIQSSGVIRPKFAIGPPEAFHPTVINKSFLVNTLINNNLYFPQFNNIGFRNTFSEFYYTVHGSGNFTPPVYVTNH